MLSLHKMSLALYRLEGARKSTEKEDEMQMRSALMLALVVGSLGGASLVLAADAAKPMPGRDVAFNRSKGNCLSCHAIPNDPKAESPGNIAPPFVMMKARYPDRNKLRAQIWDASVANPKTAMPPFGKHQILTEQEIDQVTDYIQSL